MTESFVIRWKSKVNGRAGRGRKSFPREEAERLAQELNLEYPEIEHDAVSEKLFPAIVEVEDDEAAEVEESKEPANKKETESTPGTTPETVSHQTLSE
jgi:hypothetical protein